MAASPSPRQRAAFIDSTTYFALIRERDQNHHAARLILSKLQKERWHLYTTVFVLAEVHALIVNRLRRIDLGLAFLQSVRQSSSTVIVQPTSSDLSRAIEILERYRDKDFSLADATSFAVMERLRISHAVAFDAHFSQYGWTMLTAGGA